MVKLDIPEGNFILNNESGIEKVRHCAFCYDRMIYVDVLKSIKCVNCGYQMKIEDAQPRSKLVSNADSDKDIIVQPLTDNNNKESDIPRRFKEVKQTDLNYK